MTMSSVIQDHSKRRYQVVTEEKAGGATYTPKSLADFVSKQMLDAINQNKTRQKTRILDPAVGDGELLVSLLTQLENRKVPSDVNVYGFETDENAAERAEERLRLRFPALSINIQRGDFLNFVLEKSSVTAGLFASNGLEQFDLIIANPPYVRTQIMGASQAQLLAKQFGLGGRVDLYHAFILAMAEALAPIGTAGIIVSNRFMTTKSGASIRRIIREVLEIDHVWDFGDTKLFNAAVLPAVLLLHGKSGQKSRDAKFTSIYETSQAASVRSSDPMSAVLQEGTIEVDDGRRFEVRHGRLDSRGSSDEVWRISTEIGDDWLAMVEQNSWGTFRDIGKIRVGVKTCADDVFIHDDWEKMGYDKQPELLRPLITHHIARRYKAGAADKPRRILYPHKSVNGDRMAANLLENPRTKAYLESHRNMLESRRYVIEGGRKWYEIWVPQDPGAWEAPKLVFRDISEEPTFWIDLEGSIVNGDCYWLVADKKENDDLLWLAVAAGNSTFIEAFYDHRFHNKLYSGRRRFMMQYVEQFPLPDPHGKMGKSIIAKAKAPFEIVEKPTADSLQLELDQMVWEAFGLSFKEVCSLSSTN